MRQREGVNEREKERERESRGESMDEEKRTRRSHWVALWSARCPSATVTRGLFVYRFVFQTSNFRTCVSERARAREHVYDETGNAIETVSRIQTSDCVYVVRLDFIAGADVHEGFDYTAKIFRAMHAPGAFNILLLFAFRFCYANPRCTLHSYINV